MNRMRGRPRLDASDETVVRSYRITEKDYYQLKEWSKKTGIKLSEAVRVGLSQLRKGSNLPNLLEDECLRKMAFNLIK